MRSTSPSLAVIDGTLRQFTREGARSVDYTPLATAVLEFRQSPWRVLVREHPHGLLPGMPNLYCLDGALRLRWMAEWPESIGACTRIVAETDEIITVEAADGVRVRLETLTGRLVGVDVRQSEVG